MNAHAFTFAGAALEARGSGALFWPEHGTLVVSDLHFGKSARLSAIGGAQLPPYETRETLTRLEADLAETRPRQVICLGDSFDTGDIEAALPQAERRWIARLADGRQWHWIEGNHDPGSVTLCGMSRPEMHLGPLVFRHIAVAGACAEVSGHYHPKIALMSRGRSLMRPCFLVDAARLIMPAYGTYAGGLRSDSATLSRMMAPGAQAILTGRRPCAVPMPRRVPA